MGKFHDSDPSRVWRFGCKPPRPGADVARLIEHQYWLAHRYYNDLVAMSRQKLQETKILTRKYSPQLARLEDKERKLKDDIEAIREKISERNAGTQKRTGTPQERKQIANLKKKQKMLYKAIKERRHALWGEAPPKDPNKPKRKKDDPIRIVRIGGNPDFLLGMEELENKFLNQKKHMRANNGIFWGTYLKVEAAWEQACKDSAKYQAAPDFRHWTGNGVLAVQLQDPGITVDEARSGDDSRFRLIMQPDHRSSRGQNGRVYIKVGNNGREPIFINLACRIHRDLDTDLPPNARIKWAVLVRRRYGAYDPYNPKYLSYYRYYLDLTFASKAGFEKPGRAKTGTVSINTGNRKLADGSIRVARWVGIDGVHGIRDGQFVIPPHELTRWSKADELHSIRDTNFNMIRDLLKAWLIGDLTPWEARYPTPYPNWLYAAFRMFKLQRIKQSAGKVVIPDWFKESTAYISQWKGQRRLAGLIGVGTPRPPREGEGPPPIRWRENRFPGDEDVFGIVDCWLRQDIHLWNWQANVQRKAWNWRNKQFEKFAKTLREAYGFLRVAGIDQAKLARRAKPEDEKEAPQPARSNRFIAAPGRLVEILKDSFGKPYTTVIDPKQMTQTCYICGCQEKWDAAEDVMHCCTKCKNDWDQDYGHCMNLLGWRPGDKEVRGPSPYAADPEGSPPEEPEVDGPTTEDADDEPDEEEPDDQD
jgi:hypothetical protein